MQIEVGQWWYPKNPLMSAFHVDASINNLVYVSFKTSDPVWITREEFGILVNNSKAELRIPK